MVRKLFLLFGLYGFFPLTTHALTTSIVFNSNPIEVSAVIQAGCLFQQSPTGLNFGSFASTSQSQITASVTNANDTWNIECTPGIPVTLDFNNGNNYDVAGDTRRLKHENSNQYIAYSIFSDNNRTQLINTSSPGNRLTLTSTEVQTLLPFNIYGFIDLSQGNLNKMPGPYSDNITITINW